MSETLIPAPALISNRVHKKEDHMAALERLYVFKECSNVVGT